MIRQVHLNLRNRPSVDFRMDLIDSAQSHAIAAYLNADALPEPELIALMVRAIRPGDYAVDCGACTGFFSLLMGALGAEVLAVEPGENNLPELYANAALNPFPIDIRPVALGQYTKERDFLLIEDGGANSFTQPADRPPGTPTRVSVRRLGGLVEVAPKFIKLDVEGAEVDVMKGWFLHQPPRCPYIACEYNLESLERAGHTGEDLRDLMRAHGYEMFVLYSDGMLPMLIPSNVRVNCTRQNINVLFSTPEDVGRLWQEVTL